MFAGKEKRVWVAEIERNLFKETINKVYSADKLTKVQNKKNFCGGRLFLIKSQLQPSTPRKSPSLGFFQRMFLQSEVVPVPGSTVPFRLYSSRTVFRLASVFKANSIVNVI